MTEGGEMAAAKQVKRVFLSSTAGYLNECRKAAHDAIEKLGHHCVWMEGLPASGESPEAYCAKQVGECDLFVGLLGETYGSSPEGKEISFTELEFDVAQRLGIECLMFLTSDEFSVPGKTLREEGRVEAQARFREKVNRKLIRGKFSTPDELKFQVAAALPKLAGAAPGKVDCVILCGGSAARLWPLTRGFCKVLLPVAGRPVLDHVLDRVGRCRGVGNTYLVTNDAFEGQLREFLTGCGRADVEIIVEPARKPGYKLGPIGALDHVVSLQEARDLLVLGGDNLFEFDLGAFIEFARQKGATTNALYRFETGCEAKEYGVATLNADETVKEFNEKLLVPGYLNVSTACYLFQEPEVRAISTYLKGGNDANSLGSFIHWLVVSGKHVAGKVFSEPWFDIGGRRQLLEANAHFLVDSRQGTQDRDTVVRGPAQVEKGAVLRHARVGPNVYVGAGAEIAESTVRDSVIMAGATVRRSTVTESIVGPDSTVEGQLTAAVVGRGAHILTESPRPYAGEAGP